MTTSPGGTVTIPIKVSGFTGVTSFQFSLQWDPAKLTFQTLGGYGLNGLSSGNFNLLQTNQGQLSVSWDDTTATRVTLADGSAIFTVQIGVTAAAGQCPVTIADQPTAREVTVDFDVATFAAVSGGVAVQGPPRLSQACVAGNQFRVTVEGSAGTNYYLLQSTNLWEWTTNQTLVLTNSTQMLSLPIVEQQMFFRLQQRP